MARARAHTHHASHTYYVHLDLKLPFHFHPFSAPRATVYSVSAWAVSAVAVRWMGRGETAYWYCIGSGRRGGKAMWAVVLWDVERP